MYCTHPGCRNGWLLSPRGLHREPDKKVLCGSPVFRIASTSTDAGIARGASLSTLPIEVGIKVASAIGQQVARRYVGVAAALVESRAKRVVPLAKLKTAERLAHRGYHGLGIGTAVQQTRNNSASTGRYDALMTEDLMNTPVSIIGSDAGPETPFPLRFEGKVSQGTGLSTAQLGIPTANLVDVPDTVKMRLAGVFAAWACVLPQKESFRFRVTGTKPSSPSRRPETPCPT